MRWRICQLNLVESGRGTRIRTLDLRIKSPLLYQLSYTPDSGSCPARRIGRAGRKGTDITPGTDAEARATVAARQFA